MGFLAKEEKENLLIEYNLLREEILDRDYKTWVVNSILIIGSLIVVFAPITQGFSPPILSVVLIAAALVLHVTSERVTNVAYDRIEEISKQLRLMGPTKMYESKIAGQSWYVARRNIAYALFTVLISVYLYIIISNLLALIIPLIVGFLVLLIRETSTRQEERRS